MSCIVSPNQSIIESKIEILRFKYVSSTSLAYTITPNLAFSLNGSEDWHLVFWNNLQNFYMPKHQVHWKAQRNLPWYILLFTYRKKKKKGIKVISEKFYSFFLQKKVTTYTRIKEAYGKHIYRCQQECWITLQTTLSCFLIKASRLMPCPRALVNVCYSVTKRIAVTAHNQFATKKMKPFCIKQQSWTCKHKKHLHSSSDPFKAMYVYMAVAHFKTNTIKEFQKLSFHAVKLALFCIWNWLSVFNVKTKQGKNYQCYYR